MTVGQFLARFAKAKRLRDGSHMVRCPGPGHTDTTPSLHVTATPDRILLKCFGGCSTDAILSTMSLTPADLFFEKLSPNGHKPRTKRTGAARDSGSAKRILRYELRDVEGRLVAIHVRRDRRNGKEMWWESPDGSRGLAGLRTADLPLYGVHQLQGRPDELVILGEGEKSTQALLDVGYLAVGTVTGANVTPSDETLRPLVGRDVTVWPDNDDAGRAHMRRIVAAIERLGGKCRWVDWTDAPQKGDAADFIARHSGKEVLEELLSAAGSYQASQPKHDQTWKPDRPPQPSDATLPLVVVNDRRLREISADALIALEDANCPPLLFCRSAKLALVRSDEHGRPIIENMSEWQLRGRLERVANFVQQHWNDETKTTQNEPVPPPIDVVRDVQALGEWPFPPLDGVVEVPVLRPDGSILIAPGYDRNTSLVYAPAPGLAIPAIPETPTPDGMSAALALIDEMIGEFPYVDSASRANTMALLLTPVIRATVDGCVPLALVDKPSPGTGASLLASAIALVATGHSAAMMGAPKDDEEWRKAITSLLMAGATFVLVDNVQRSLESSSLARALTAQSWQDRILGRNAILTLPQRATWLATGNNLRVRNDMARRCYWIRMNAQMAQPWRRTEFRHPDLLDWVASHRGAILAALLTLARAWFTAGQPPAKVPTLGGFETWARVVGGVLAYAGIAGFLGNLEELYERVDEEGPQWSAFVAEWYRVFGEVAISVAELANALEANEAFSDSLPDTLAASRKDEKTFRRNLGQALKKHADVRYDVDGTTLRLVRAKSDTHAKVARWQVCGDRGDVRGPGNPETGKNSEPDKDENVTEENNPRDTRNPRTAPSHDTKAEAENPDHEDDRHSRILAAGHAIGWPRVDIGRGESIASGELAWRLFCGKATEAQIARAIEALSTVDTNGHGAGDAA